MADDKDNTKDPSNRWDPKTEVQETIQDAITVMVVNRDQVQIPQETFLKLCKADPDYAKILIAARHTALTKTPGKAQHAIKSMVYEAEWMLAESGPGDSINEFIKRHSFGMSDDNHFLREKLRHSPESFCKADLNLLLQQFSRRDHPIHKLALGIKAQHVKSFAERLTIGPSALSEDKASLKESINQYGFTSELNEVLQKVDEELQQELDAFDQLAVMKHLRSFFEKLNKYIGEELRAQRLSVGNGTNLGQCQKAIDYLEKKKVITEKMRVFGRALYGILSDDAFGVHALKATRDYTRFCQSMVIEYAVTLFFEFERRLAEPGDD